MARRPGKPPELSHQVPLFSQERVVERVIRSGVTIRTVLEPADGGHVRITGWYRMAPGGSWERRPQEERTVPFSSLGLEVSQEELFGAGGDHDRP